MGQDFNSFFCAHCNDRSMFVRNETRHGMHIVLSLLTAGIWLVPYVVVLMSKPSFRCSKCGSKPHEGGNAVAGKPSVSGALPAVGVDSAEQVKKLHDLHLSGALNEAEYDAAKKKALGL